MSRDTLKYKQERKQRRENLAALVHYRAATSTDFVNNIVLILENDTDFAGTFSVNTQGELIAVQELPWRDDISESPVFDEMDADTLIDKLRDDWGDFVPARTDYLDGLVQRAIARFAEKLKSMLL